MIKKSLSFAALLLLGLSPPSLQAQSTPEPASGALEVITTNAADQEKRLRSYDGIVPLVLVRPNQVLPITLQFPAGKAGTPVAATPLDGGRVNGGTPTVLPTGRVVLTFSPGPAPGRYRVVVQTPLEQHLLEFYVVDANHDPRHRRR